MWDGGIGDKISVLEAQYDRNFKGLIWIMRLPKEPSRRFWSMPMEVADAQESQSAGSC